MYKTCISVIYIPLKEIGLLGIHQCTSYRRGQYAGKFFILASELQHHSQSRIRPRHKLAINRLTLLCTIADHIENSLTSQERVMWDWNTKQSILRNVLKACYGQLWNMNMAYVLYEDAIQ